MRVPPRTIAIALAITGVCAAFAACIAPIVRARLDRAAGARGLTAEVGHVSLGWFAVALEDVHLRQQGSGLLDARVKELRVELGPILAVGALRARGVDISLLGTRDELDSALRAWRGAPAPASVSSARAPDISAENVGVTWREHAGEVPRLEVKDAAGARDEQGWRGSLGQGIARDGAHEVVFTAAAIRVRADGAIADGHASAITVAFQRHAEESGEAVEPANEPPPLPIANAKQVATDPSAVRKLRLPLPDLHAVHAEILALAALARDRLAPEARLDADSLRCVVMGDKKGFAVGQGPVSLERTDAAVQLTFSTRARAQGAPLSLMASLPFAGGDTVVSLDGGPLSLATLGVDEGTASLVGVDATTLSGRGRLALAASGETLTFDGQLTARGLALDNPRIASEAVRGLDVTVLARGVLDDHGSLRADDAELAIGSLRVIAHGHAEQSADSLAATLDVELPDSPCGALLTSVPSALLPTLDGAEMTGTVGARGTIAFDTAKLDDATFDWNVEDRCAMSIVPEELAKERFSQPFEHTIYEPDGTLEQETTGPTSDNWTELGQISPYMQVAVITTEDGAFYRHHGFNRAAMRNALVADLKAGRFARGASTITMQLAKNLFLSRAKTVSRKLEEVILADYLESAFTKEEMMELYLNVIEFGPGVYGITQAAAHYFGRSPAELNLAECLFLSSILPSPLRYAKLAESVELSPSWTERLRALMAIGAKLGTISDAELAEGLTERVVFHHAGDPPPEPRPPVVGTHFQATHARKEGEWQATP